MNSLRAAHSFFSTRGLLPFSRSRTLSGGWSPQDGYTSRVRFRSPRFADSRGHFAFYADLRARFGLTGQWPRVRSSASNQLGCHLRNLRGMNNTSARPGSPLSTTPPRPGLKSRPETPLLLPVHPPFPCRHQENTAATRKPRCHRGQPPIARIGHQPGHLRLVLIPEKPYEGAIGLW